MSFLPIYIFLCANLIYVYASTPNTQQTCQKELFNNQNRSPFLKNGNVDFHFFLDDSAPFMILPFWSPHKFGSDGQTCNITTLMYKKTSDTCHEFITFRYLSKLGSEFKKEYHSFFGLVWTPENDDTYLSITYIHHRNSPLEVLLNLTNIVKDVTEMVEVTLTRINKTEGIQTLKLSQRPLKKNLMYALSVTIKELDEFDEVRHGIHNLWFSILSVHLNWEAADCMNEVDKKISEEKTKNEETADSMNTVDKEISKNIGDKSSSNGTKQDNSSSDSSSGKEKPKKEEMESMNFQDPNDGLSWSNLLSFGQVRSRWFGPKKFFNEMP